MELRRQPCIRAACNDHNPLQLYFLKILPKLLCNDASSRCDARVCSEITGELLSETMPMVVPQPMAECSAEGSADVASQVVDSTERSSARLCISSLRWNSLHTFGFFHAHIYSTLRSDKTYTHTDRHTHVHCEPA